MKRDLVSINITSSCVVQLIWCKTVGEKEDRGPNGDVGIEGNIPKLDDDDDDDDCKEANLSQSLHSEVTLRFFVTVNSLGVTADHTVGMS